MCFKPSKTVLCRVWPSDEKSFDVFTLGDFVTHKLIAFDSVDGSVIGKIFKVDDVVHLVLFQSELSKIDEEL